MNGTIFKGCPIVTASALNNDTNELTDALLKATFIPERSADKPFLFAVDHCFALKGKGTILTGRWNVFYHYFYYIHCLKSNHLQYSIYKYNLKKLFEFVFWYVTFQKFKILGTVLQGKAKVNDDIEIPSIALTRKIKSIEMFKTPVDSIMQGDRAGICVTKFDPKTLERGLACELNYLPKIYAAIIDFNKVKYYKSDICSKSNFHINVGYENVIAKITLFGCEKNSGTD